MQDSDSEPEFNEIQSCKEKIIREGIVLDIAKYGLVPVPPVEQAGLAEPVSLQEGDMNTVQDNISDILQFLGNQK